MGHIPVVVRGGAPGVPLHRPGEKISVFVHHGGEQACLVVKHIPEGLSGKDHLIGTGLHLEGALRGGGVQEEGLLPENQLVKAQGMPGLIEGAVLLGGVEEGHSDHAALGQLGQG